MKKYIVLLLICCIIPDLFPDAAYISTAFILPSRLNSDDLKRTIDAYMAEHEAAAAAMSVDIPGKNRTDAIGLQLFYSPDLLPFSIDQHKTVPASGQSIYKFPQLSGYLI